MQYLKLAAALLAALTLTACAVQTGTSIHSVKVLPDLAPRGAISAPAFIDQSELHGATLVIEVTHDGHRPSRCNLVGLDLDGPQSIAAQRRDSREYTRYGRPRRDARFSLYGVGFSTAGGVPLRPGYENAWLGRVVLPVPADGIILVHLSGARLDALRREEERRNRSDPTLSVYVGVGAALEPYPSKTEGLGTLLYYREQVVTVYTQGDHC